MSCQPPRGRPVRRTVRRPSRRGWSPRLVTASQASALAATRCGRRRDPTGARTGHPGATHGTPAGHHMRTACFRVKVVSSRCPSGSPATTSDSTVAPRQAGPAREPCTPRGSAVLAVMGWRDPSPARSSRPGTEPWSTSQDVKSCARPHPQPASPAFRLQLTQAGEASPTIWKRASGSSLTTALASRRTS